MSVFVKKKSKFLLVAFFLAAIVSVFVYTLFEPTINLYGFVEFDQRKLIRADRTITVAGGDGSAIDSGLYGSNGKFCPISDLSEKTINAFVAVEDKRFYSHHGVDYFRILSAAKNNFISGRTKEGASTITQQLVKNTYLSNEKTLKRKINEIRIAKEIERRYAKREILESYLNMLYFGNNVYGIGAAAERYFGKDAAELTVSESALLAGIINSPALLDPFVHADKAIARRNSVLGKMYNQQIITKKEYKSALREEPVFNRSPICVDTFLSKAFSEARNFLSGDNIDIFNGKYFLCTMYDKALTKKCSDIVDKYSIDDGFIEIMIADNETGACIVNVTDAKKDLGNILRLPGSAIKPFVCYAPAIEKKLVYPVTPILDEKIDFSGYSPENYDKKYHGWVSVEESLVYSYNIPAVKLLRQNGIKYSREIAEKFGLFFDESDDSLALALGAMAHGVSLASLVESYMTLARGGNHTDLYFISAIFDENDKCVYRHRGESYRAIGDDTAFLITDMLTECINVGTAKRLKNRSQAQIAAKTGTVGSKNGNSDAYCIAYSPKYTVAVRVTANDGKLLPNEISGGTIPSSIAAEIFGLFAGNERFNVPASVIGVDISRSQLADNQKIIPSNSSAKEKDVITAYFSRRNMPYAYDLWFDGGLDNFDNFDIVDSFFD